MSTKNSILTIIFFFISPVLGFLTSLFNTKSKSSALVYVGFATLFGYAISQSIGSEQFTLVLELIKEVNEKFQEHIQSKYAQIKNSNPIKKPQIVSKILDYIDFN